MHKVIQLISKKLYNKNMPLFYENICSLYELDEKSNYTKISKSLNFEERASTERTFFLNHLTK
jgi:hypothetical protein